MASTAPVAPPFVAGAGGGSASNTPGASGGKKKWASPEDWAAHKQIIIDLYQEKELTEVMEIMEKEYSFFSTRRIYKTRIKDWGIGKRLTDDDVLAILFLKAQRETLEKDSEFWIGGTRVENQKIQRYVRRNPRLLVRLRHGHKPNIDETRVTCRTPPPLLPEPELLWAVAAGASVGSTATYRETEVILLNIRDYMRSSLDTGAWILDTDGVCISARGGRLAEDQADDVWTKFYTAADSLVRADFSGAFKILDLAFRSVGELLPLNCPKVLPTILICLSRLDRRGQHDTLRIFRKYVEDQSAALEATGVGDTAKLAAVLGAVARLDVARYEDAFPRMIEYMLGQSDELLGPASNLSSEIFFYTFGSYNMLKDQATQVCIIDKQLAKIRRAASRSGSHSSSHSSHSSSHPSSGRSAPWVLKQERLRAWKMSQWLSSIGDFDGAAAALDGVLHTYSVTEPMQTARHYGFVAMLHRAKGDLVGEEAAWRTSARFAFASGDEDAVQFSLANIAATLDKIGRADAAALTRQYARSRLEHLASAVMWDWNEFERRTAILAAEIGRGYQDAAPGPYASTAY